MATEEIQISQLELAQEVQGDMVFAVDTATDTKSLSVNQLKNHISQPLQANINAVDTSALHKYNISNCITEIPQDIKLELNNGTLILKAGSKVYVPNGFETDGTTPKFDTVNIQSDISSTNSSWGQSCIWVYHTGLNAITSLPISKCYSGNTAPSGITGPAYWYDTTNNIIKITSDGSTWVNASVSFPFAICTDDGINVTSIDQVFNGFGYIGSTVFALPNVKGLIPNGRNADGTLKNDTLELQNVKIYTETSYTGNAKIVFTSNGSFDFSSYSTWNYDESSNLFKYTSDGKLYSRLILTGLSLLSGKITTFEIPTAFHAVDYNDFEKAMLKEDWVRVSTAPASPDSSKFYYIPEN